MNRANYRVIMDRPDRLVIEDLGPWHKHPTVTNDAERVVADLLPRLNGRKLFYFDSECDFGELVHDGKTFKGFRPATIPSWMVR